MVQDEDIKLTVSPFIVKPGEIKTFDGKDALVTTHQIIERMNKGHITEVHFKILEIVNEFEFITSRQIFQILEHRGIEIKSQDKLNDKLNQLIKLKILSRYFFMTEEGRGSYRVYCLEKMGKYILDSREIMCNWQVIDNTKPVYMIKQRLAGNQVIIAHLRKVKAFDSYIVKPTLTTKQSKKIVKPHAGIKLTKGENSIELIYDAVRREDEWEKRFITRMKLLQEFYNNFIPSDSGYKQKPQLIFLCEDNKHMTEVFKIIVTNKLEPNELNLFFTTDLKQNEKSLNKSLVQFKLNEETRKYEAKYIEFKILK